MTYGESVFPELPRDPAAYVFTREAFGADPSGREDNAQALQRAIDRVEAEVKNGILFIPEGTYRFAGTVNLWRGIRLIGFGGKRPAEFVDGLAFLVFALGGGVKMVELRSPGQDVGQV